jgi:N-acetylglucosaminyldiphosphoundecaprenol N-acetyl-beta-D-mannosaminyltransferase
MVLQSVNICGVRIDKISFDEAVESIVHHALSPGAAPRYVVTPNAQHILLRQRDALFREIYKNAFLIVPDGVALLWAARFLGTPLCGRVNGTDLFERLCEVAVEAKLRIFLHGGRPGAADTAAQILQARYSGLDIVGTYCPPYEFEIDSAELALINAKIELAAPHILFVGLGSPKGEYWIFANHRKIRVPISIGIGASFDFVSGMVKRAPKWMQRSGLEWFFRLMIEPRRLWKRYIIGNPLFLWLVLRQRFGLLRLDDPASGTGISKRP